MLVGGDGCFLLLLALLAAHGGASGPPLPDSVPPVTTVIGSFRCSWTTLFAAASDVGPSPSWHPLSRQEPSLSSVVLRHPEGSNRSTAKSRPPRCSKASMSPAEMPLPETKPRQPRPEKNVVPPDRCCWRSTAHGLPAGFRSVAVQCPWWWRARSAANLGGRDCHVSHQIRIR